MIIISLTWDGAVDLGLVLDDVPGGGDEEEGAEYFDEDGDHEGVLERFKVHFGRVAADGRLEALGRGRALAGAEDERGRLRQQQVRCRARQRLGRCRDQSRVRRGQNALQNLGYLFFFFFFFFFKNLKMKNEIENWKMKLKNCVPGRWGRDCRRRRVRATVGSGTPRPSTVLSESPRTAKKKKKGQTSNEVNI